MWPTTNVVDVTGPSTPRLRSAPRTNVVLPAPSSPETSTTSPGASVLASRAPARSVSSGPAVSSIRLTEARAEGYATAEQQDAGDGDRPAVDACVGQGRTGRCGRGARRGTARGRRGCGWGLGGRGGRAWRRARGRRRRLALVVRTEGIGVLVVAGALSESG